MLTLGTALAADIDSVVAEYTVSSSIVAVSSRDHWSFHLRNVYGMLGCDFVVRSVVAMAIAIAAVVAFAAVVAVRFVDHISAMVATDF